MSGYATTTAVRNVASRGEVAGPSPEIIELIGSLPVKCYFNHLGCDERIRCEDLSAHVGQCLYRLRACPKRCRSMIPLMDHPTHMLTYIASTDPLLESLMCYHCKNLYNNGSRPTHCDYYLLAQNLWSSGGQNRYLERQLNRNGPTEQPFGLQMTDIIRHNSRYGHSAGSSSSSTLVSGRLRNQDNNPSQDNDNNQNNDPGQDEDVHPLEQSLQRQHKLRRTNKPSEDYQTAD